MVTQKCWINKVIQVVDLLGLERVLARKWSERTEGSLVDTVR